MTSDAIPEPETVIDTTAESPASLADLTHTSRTPKPWLLNLVQREVGGGRARLDDLAPTIDAHPSATALMVSGLDQPAFEGLVERFGARFRGIYLWKCPRITDLTPLEALPGLRYLAIYWNQRTTRFWDFSRNPELRGVDLQDFTRVHRLDDLALATTLDELRFGDMIWPSWVFESLEPLAALPQLRSLAFDAKRIDDGRIQPLAALRQLTSLAYPAHQFTTRQVAWLRAHLAETLVSRSLDPFWDFRDKPIVGSQRVRDILIVGKRKPWLDSNRDAARIERYVADFRAMVEEFGAHPDLEPD